jgi:AcrR family transcriptional regulator
VATRSASRDDVQDAERTPLTRERVLREAVALADELGVSGVTMRRLGQRLGVEAMSLYNHVSNKEDLLNGMADLVAAEFDVPAPGEEWRDALTRTATSAHAAVARHPWAGSLLESRSSLGPARLRYLDAVVGTLLDAGFPLELTYHAMLTLDSYIYGFALQEASAPAAPEQAAPAAEQFVAALPTGEYPNLVSMAHLVMRPDHDSTGDFAFGLALVLDALALRRPDAPRAQP